MPEGKIFTEETSFIKATGFSMYPFLRDRDKVIFRKARSTDLMIGDIILCKNDSNGQTICHRLVKKTMLKDKNFTTCEPESRRFAECRRLYAMLKQGRLENNLQKADTCVR